MVALGIIESEFTNSSILRDVYLPPSYDHFFAVNVGYLPLTNCGTQDLDFIKQFERG